MRKGRQGIGRGVEIRKKGEKSNGKGFIGQKKGARRMTEQERKGQNVRIGT